MPRGRKRRFTQIKMQRILDEAALPGATQSAVAEKYGVHATTLRKWKQRLDAKPAMPRRNRAAVLGRRRRDETDVRTPSSKLEVENRLLRQLVMDLTLENYRLKTGILTLE